MGVFLPDVRLRSLDGCLPHARGGVSRSRCLYGISGMSSPRTWGCFCDDFYFFDSRRVFPTHVGVFLSLNGRGFIMSCLPHARGGVSSAAITFYVSGESSPRTWGCFFLFLPIPCGALVFPTHVGVFLCDSGLNISSSGSSPRTWGCFSTGNIVVVGKTVFPTHVGVFPISKKSLDFGRSLPHARGGVSS